ncbi:MAG: hypothetical protein ACRDSH_11595, partial [Pseudonocardiaceae bacterium]
GGCGDPELSQELRDALGTLREHSDNDDFRTVVADVLAGRCSLTDASRTAAFGDVVFAGIAQEFNQLPEGEKQRLAARAEPSGREIGSCGAPCATCSGICSALRGGPSQ